MTVFTRWINEFDLFLFDLDGLLVDTEYLHYQSYQKMCLDRGFVLPWDFVGYCSMAHTGSDLFQKEVYKVFPNLYEQEPNWTVLHQEKQRAFLDNLSQKEAVLMPGVREVLNFLYLKKARCCVVTHSPKELAEALKKQNPVLQTITHWITREQYNLPKPSPDSYLKAVKLYGQPRARVLGFEDTIRGWKALQSAGIQAVLVSSVLTKEMKLYLRENGAEHYNSFQELIL